MIAERGEVTSGQSEDCLPIRRGIYGIYSTCLDLFTKGLCIEGLCAFGLGHGFNMSLLGRHNDSSLGKSIMHNREVAITPNKGWWERVPLLGWVPAP